MQGFSVARPPSRLIRMSSTNLNNLIGGGAIILYMDTYFFVIPTTNPQVVTALCNLTPWLTALGYSLCYGTILAKMVRVYYIFDNPTPHKRRWVLRNFKCKALSPQHKLKMPHKNYTIFIFVSVKFRCFTTKNGDRDEYGS